MVLNCGPQHCNCSALRNCIVAALAAISSTFSYITTQLQFKTIEGRKIVKKEELTLSRHSKANTSWT